MLLFKDAENILKKVTVKKKAELIDFMRSQGRVLAEDIKSDIHMPPFDKSGMDGYAYNTQSSAKSLNLIEVIPAGHKPKKKLKLNECSKIMTGAMIPQGANAVAMVEKTTETDGRVTILKKDSKDNILKKAEDLKQGAIVLKKGTLIRAQEIAILATFGRIKVKVYTQPNVGVISTGTEIVEPKNKPKAAQIRNSNGYMLLASVANAGALGHYYGIVDDDPKELEKVIDKACRENDIVIFTGGVSMGDFDFLPAVFKKKNIKLIFQKLAIQPGKPTVFGKKQDTYFFGLPGNPVSAFVTFHLLVRPLITSLMGYELKEYFIKAKLTGSIKRKRADRQLFHPVKFVESGLVAPINYHGSGHLHSLCQADGLVVLEAGIKVLQKGKEVHVRSI